MDLIATFHGGRTSCVEDEKRVHAFYKNMFVYNHPLVFDCENRTTFIEDMFFLLFYDISNEPNLIRW